MDVGCNAFSIEMKAMALVQDYLGSTTNGASTVDGFPMATFQSAVHFDGFQLFYRSIFGEDGRIAASPQYKNQRENRKEIIHR